jgi:hypothetical protein
MKPTANRHWDRDTTWIALLACCASILAFVWYARAGELLLYGDAVAHINISRRVFDSRTPGLLQLGTVWLPLPHLLTMPFIVNRAMWRSGIGGSIPSMVAYVFAVVGIFRLTRDVGRVVSLRESVTRLIAWAAAAVFGLNPNLLYMQATAMTEALYLALFVWAVLYFLEFVSEAGEGLQNLSPLARRLLMKCGLCVAAACLTRYDGWFLAGILCAAMAVLVWHAPSRRAAFPVVARFGLLAATVPVFWLAYNAAVYRNPLEFANGPYSAKAIERKTAEPGAPPHPGTNNLAVAAAYFGKSGLINVAEGWLEAVWLLLALTTSIVLIRTWLGAFALLLWVPIPFYALSIAYGGVPIFMPTWWPYSAYNVRYGLQLLPAFSVLVPLSLAWIASRFGAPFRLAAPAAALFFLASYAAVWRATPVCYREAWINSRTRLALETQLANQLRLLPPDASFLMYLGSHVGALEEAGIPLARSVNEGNHRVWMQPSDPQGLWERSLANPAAHVDYVVAFEGDPVADAMRSRTLPALVHIEVQGQASATIYRAR